MVSNTLAASVQRRHPAWWFAAAYFAGAILSMMLILLVWQGSRAPYGSVAAALVLPVALQAAACAFFYHGILRGRGGLASAIVLALVAGNVYVLILTANLSWRSTESVARLLLVTWFGAGLAAGVTYRLRSRRV